MQMPLVVGILIAIIFLIAFSEWFYHMVEGWGSLVIDDDYFRYRIIGVTLFSFFLFSASFYTMALVSKCPNEEVDGFYASLKCEEYLQIKAGAESIFETKNSKTQDL